MLKCPQTNVRSGDPNAAYAETFCPCHTAVLRYGSWCHHGISKLSSLVQRIQPYPTRQKRLVMPSKAADGLKDPWNRLLLDQCGWRNYVQRYIKLRRRPKSMRVSMHAELALLAESDYMRRCQQSKPKKLRFPGKP